MTLYEATYGKLATLRAEIAGIERTLNNDGNGIIVVLNREVIERHLGDLRAILKQRQG